MQLSCFMRRCHSIYSPSIDKMQHHFAILYPFLISALTSHKWRQVCQFQIASRLRSNPPCDGCDMPPFNSSSILYCFNPRPPRGVRHIDEFANIGQIPFQSTHPARDATNFRFIRCSFCRFQPTHPEESATVSWSWSMGADRFNPRTPRGVRPDRLPFQRLLG